MFEEKTAISCQKGVPPFSDVLVCEGPGMVSLLPEGQARLIPAKFPDVFSHYATRGRLASVALMAVRPLKSNNRGFIRSYFVHSMSARKSAR